MPKSILKKAEDIGKIQLLRVNWEVRLMSLHKAILHKKEHRVEYGTKGQPYCKAVDPNCRNHGSCVWCENNRTYKNKEKDRLAKAEIKKMSFR